MLNVPHWTLSSAVQVEEGKRYTIREHSRRVISRGIVLPQTVLEPANAVEQDITMAFDFQATLET